MKKSKIVALLLVLAMFSNFVIPFNKVLAVNNSNKDTELPTNGLEEIEGKEISKEELESIKCPDLGIDNTKAPNLYAFSRNNYNSDYGYNRLDTEGKREIYQNILYISYLFHSSNEDLQEQNGSYPIYILDVSKYELTTDEVFKVYLTFYYDNPEFYWLNNGVSYYYNPETGKATRLVLSAKGEYAVGSTRTNLTKTIERNIENYLDYVSPMKNDFEKELMIHNALIYYNDYAYDSNGEPELSSFAHNIVGVFDNDSKTAPVCEGYAKAFMLLCNASGIDCGFIGGLGNGGGHAWNQVKLDNEWYNVDVTWDDPTITGQEPPYTTPYFDFFNVTDAKFTDTHVAFPSTNPGSAWCYDTFKCTSTKYSIENQIDNIPDMDLLNTVTYDSTEEMPLCIFNQGVEVPSTSKVLPGTKLKISLLSKETNIADVYEVDVNGVRIPLTKVADANSNGYIEYGADYTAIDQAMEFKIVEKSNTDFNLLINKKNITFYDKDASEKITVTYKGKVVDNSTLTFTSDNPFAATVNADGTVTAISNGTAIVKVYSAELDKEVTCNVTCNLSYLLGDVDNDGDVKIYDAYALLQFLSIMTTSPNVSVLRAADFNEDGTISIFDAYELLVYLSQKI